MTARKARLGAEESGHKVPPSGPQVFKPSPGDKRPQVRVPLSVEPDGEGGYIEKGFVARWPASVGGSVQYGNPEPEIIDMSQKARVRVTKDDPYEMAELRAAERKRPKQEQQGAA